MIKRLSVRGVALASSVMAILLFGCSSNGFLPLDPDARAAGRDLLSVLETGDPDRFRHYLQTQTALSVDRFFSDDARRFLFDGDWVRQSDNNGRSIVELINEDDLAIEGAVQPDGSIIMLFIPEAHLRLATEDPEFFSNQWMRKYFACSFSRFDGQWQLSNNICFAESGGPFHSPYG